MVCVWLVLAGCAPDAQDLEDPVLAVVGESRITASQLIDFERRLPKELRTRKSGLDGYRDYLQTLVDKDIFLQEALQRGLDEVPEVAGKLKKEKEERMLRALFNKEIAPEIQIEEQELKDYFETAEKGREIKLRLIVVDTRAEAEDILQSLEAGGDFAELARTLSRHKSTASQGGELDGYLTRNRIPRFLHKYIDSLVVGDLSESVRLPNGQFGIYQIIYERPVQFSSVRGALGAQLREQKTVAAMDQYAQDLQIRMELRSNAEEFEELQASLLSGKKEFSDRERGEILYEYKGGQISVGDFLDLAETLDMGFSEEMPDGVSWFAAEVMAPRVLFLRVAYDKGIDRDEEIEKWHRRRRDALLLLALRQTAVKDKIAITEEQAKRYYEERPELFTPLEEVTLQEIMVKTEEEAAVIKERIEAGEDMGALADERTLRVVGKGAQGKFHIHAHEQSFYRELIDAVRAGAVGRLQGPVKVTAQAAQVVGPENVPRGGQYYSLFKVLASNFGQSPEPFAKAEKRARALLKRAEESRLADQFLMGLRRDYRDRIVLYEDRLEALLVQ